MSASCGCCCCLRNLSGAAESALSLFMGKMNDPEKVTQELRAGKVDIKTSVTTSVPSSLEDHSYQDMGLDKNYDGMVLPNKPLKCRFYEHLFQRGFCY